MSALFRIVVLCIAILNRQKETTNVTPEKKQLQRSFWTSVAAFVTSLLALASDYLFKT